MRLLEKILLAKREAVAVARRERPLEKLLDVIRPANFSFRKALYNTPWALIAECKLASPSKGRLCTNYTVAELARMYTEAGATVLSVLTDTHFCGTLGHIGEVKQVSSLPVLRKDFVVDPYQIYEARSAGADAVLLIAGILSDEQLQAYLSLTEELGMDALVEVHTLAELQRVQQTQAGIVGINNRDLTKFVTDINTTLQLLPHCDKERLIISESGIKDGADALRLKAAGVRGVLVGEGLVTAADIPGKVRELALREKNGGI
jgi:indole-3-glycerol phosphate synthase